MESPPPALVAPVPESSVPPASHWPAPFALLAGVRPTSSPPLVSSRPRAHTHAGSARIVPPWLSCSPNRCLLSGLSSPKQDIRFLVYRWGQIRVSKGANSPKPHCS